MKLYTTKKVSELTGATPRQLQWWDDRKIVVPERKDVDRKRQRFYTIEQVRQVRRILEIRKDYKLGFKSIPATGAVKILTHPTEINGVLYIPKPRRVYV